jgi:hypothetical protein
MEINIGDACEKVNLFIKSKIYLDMISDLDNPKASPLVCEGIYADMIAGAIEYIFDNPKESPIIIEEVDMGNVPGTIKGSRY